MRNINKILKMASFYSYAVSKIFNILDSDLSLDVIAKKINSFVKQNNLSIDEHMAINYKVFQLAEDKFNKLVVRTLNREDPNLNMSEINLAQNRADVFQSKQAANQILSFCLHDMIHEASIPGNLKRFEQKDKEIRKNKSLSLDAPRYSLEEFIEEQVVASLSYDKSLFSQQLDKYVINLIKIIKANPNLWVINGDEGIDYTSTYNQQNIENFFQVLNNQIQTDVDNIGNPKYKVIGEKFFHSLKNWMNNLIKDLSSKFQDGSQFSWENEIEKPIKSKIVQWSHLYFSMKSEAPISTDSENIIYDKPVSELVDDRKAALLRLWIKSVYNIVSEAASKSSFNEFMNVLNSEVRIFIED